MKKLFIKTYGCQMNVYDSDRMADALAPAGYMPTHAPEDADMIILNTCHIREKPQKRFFLSLDGYGKSKAEQQSSRINRFLLLWQAVWLRRRARKSPGARHG